MSSAVVVPVRDVFVRGMGLSCALGLGVDACLAGLAAGAVPAQRINITGLEAAIDVPFYAIPDGADPFDPARADSLLATVAAEAIATAGLSRAEIEELPIFVGSSAFTISKSEAEYSRALRDNPSTARPLPRVGYHHMAGALHGSFGNGGDAYAFNTACTAAANALMSATRMLQLGWYENALVIGFELANLTTLSGFSGLQLIADAVRPFDVERAGVVLGEGIGAVVLSVSDRSDGGICIRGGAANVDTFSVTAANPDGSSIAAVQTALLAQTRVDAAGVRGIKTHGTASPLNDAGEAAGIRRVFGTAPRICALKPYIGHTLGACGVNELVLMVSALRAGFFPATPGFETEDPALGIRPVRQRTAALPGHYLLNYFGFGGHNTALLIEKRN